MKLKFERDLAKEYEVENFFEYIVESMINGNRQQVKDLFSRLHNDDKREFLINYLDCTVGDEKSILNICINELTK